MMHRHDHRAEAREDRFERCRGDAIPTGLLNRSEGKRDEISDVGEQIREMTITVPKRERERDVAPRLFDLAGVKVMLFQASARKERPHLRHAQRDEHAVGRRRIEARR